MSEVDDLRVDSVDSSGERPKIDISFRFQESDVARAQTKILGALLRRMVRFLWFVILVTYVFRMTVEGPIGMPSFWNMNEENVLKVC